MGNEAKEKLILPPSLISLAGNTPVNYTVIANSKY